jgi:hypothetical protein
LHTFVTSNDFVTTVGVDVDVGVGVGLDVGVDLDLDVGCRLRMLMFLCFGQSLRKLRLERSTHHSIQQAADPDG